MGVVFGAIDRELGLIEETATYPFQIHGASVAADIASSLDHSWRRLRSAPETDKEESRQNGGMTNSHRGGNRSLVQRAYSSSAAVPSYTHRTLYLARMVGLSALKKSISPSVAAAAARQADRRARQTECACASPASTPRTSLTARFQRTERARSRVGDPSSRQYAARFGSPL